MRRIPTSTMVLMLPVVALLLLTAAIPCSAQIDHNLTPVNPNAESHVDGLTGHASGQAQGGMVLYRRFCVGCHGPAGDGSGENAQWIDPKPRDFTLAVFKCRSTPTGTLPTDDDLYNAVTRGFDTTNMPAWRPLTDQQRANLVAAVKAFSPRWQNDKAGTPITIPAETPINIESVLRGRALFQKMECWKCHGPAGHGDGPSAPTLTDSKDNPIRPYNFATGTRFKCGETNQDLYKIFMTGLDGTPMPSFNDVLKPEDAWDLVHFLRTLQPLNTQEASLWKAYAAAHSSEIKPIGPDSGAGGSK
jgi:mono/diheme cytochrome c family protein